MSLHKLSNLPVVDFEVIKFLRSFDRDGSDDFLQRLADLYVKQTPIDLARLETIAATGDFNALTQAARMIKHRNENLGCLRMVHYLTQVPLVSKTAPNEVQSLLQTLLEESKLVSVALTELTGSEGFSENIEHVG